MATLVGGGGGLVNRYLLLAAAGSARADAELSTGTNSPTWGAYRGAHPPSSDSHATARTGRHPRRHTASACPAGVPVYVCLVQWLVSHCAAVTIAPPSLAHHPLSCRKMPCPTLAKPWRVAGPKKLLASVTATGPDRDRLWLRVHMLRQWRALAVLEGAIMVVLHVFPHEIQIVYTLNYYLSFTQTYHKSFSWLDQSSMKISLHTAHLFQFQWPFSPLTFNTKDMLLLLGSAAANKYTKDAFLVVYSKKFKVSGIWVVWTDLCLLVGSHN